MICSSMTQQFSYCCVCVQFNLHALTKCVCTDASDVQESILLKGYSFVFFLVLYWALFTCGLGEISVACKWIFEWSYANDIIPVHLCAILILLILFSLRYGLKKIYSLWFVIFALQRLQTSCDFFFSGMYYFIHHCSLLNIQMAFISFTNFPPICLTSIYL